MFGLYITHPQVRLDPGIPVPQWGLSDLGRDRATEAATRPWAKRLARIVSAVEEVLENHDPAAPIAFVGHGGVGTLFRCHLLGIPISRAEDQLPGGGNLYAFALADRRIACDWTPIEDWKGIDP
jgi:broad specificity phosphatase PhoE